MKKLMLLCLLAIVTCCLTSCPKDRDAVFAQYQICLNFQDAGYDYYSLKYGVELEDWVPGDRPMEEATGGTVKSGVYTLDIIHPGPCDNWDNETYNRPAQPAVNTPKLIWGKSSTDQRCYLILEIQIPVDGCQEVATALTYELMYPRLFGDSEIHEFVVYFDLIKEKNGSITGRGTRVEFKDKEYTLNAYGESMITRVEFKDEYTFNTYGTYISHPVLGDTYYASTAAITTTTIREVFIDGEWVRI